MKLELKHLAAYLPYELKVKNKECDDILTLIELDKERVGSMDDKFKYVDWIGDIKPILHPLSDLRNGDYLDLLFYGNMKCDNDREFLNALEDDIASADAKMEVAPYHLVQKLLEWHFDVFGLIKEGLAIDVNNLKHTNMKVEIYGTTESVETNPRREWKWLGQVESLTIAKKKAKRLSKMKMWHEVELEGFDDEGERAHHSYWREGKLEIDMGV